MDGYIRNKQEAIASARRAIIGKYSITILIWMMIPVWLSLGLLDNPNPDRWIGTEIVYSHISREQMGFRRGKDDVLNTADGQRFVFGGVSAQVLEEELIPGQTYTVVYAPIISGGNGINALYDENREYISMESSVAQWEQNRVSYSVAVFATAGIGILSLVLIDRLWCRKEHEKIQKLREDVVRREKKQNS